MAHLFLRNFLSQAGLAVSNCPYNLYNLFGAGNSSQVEATKPLGICQKDFCVA
jgi:hypothetical protein